MDPILDVIAAINAHEAGDKPSYRQTAKWFGVDRTTLARRHQGKTRSHAGEAQQRMLLSPQQEKQLVGYIKGLKKRGLPPTREMIQNFASVVAKWEVSDAWVTRFLGRNDAFLTSKWTVGIDRTRHIADNEERYHLYFGILHYKMCQYETLPENTYNMDEKGFFVGITTRSKRVFSKASYSRKEVTSALQDRNREWITLLACICGDGTSLSPGVIYEGKSGLQSSWVNDIEAGKHQIFCGNSSSGWSNNGIGLAWLEQVFDRETRAKARRKWRLLILDGHGSHVTNDFIDFCDDNKILLCIFPPPSTHSLQLLDVVMFSPMATYYSQELSHLLHRSQGIVGVTRSNFSTIFWPAWVRTFNRELILRSFEAVGVWPMDAQTVLKRFRKRTSQPPTTLEIFSEGYGSSWRQVRELFDAAVKGDGRIEQSQLGEALHSLQVNNDLLHHQYSQLRTALATKRRRKAKSYTLDLQQRKEFHCDAILYSPATIREAKWREKVKQDEAEAEKL
jgi:hypothetical protein